MAGRRTLVTGAGGFIGSHLAEALVAAGASVRAFVRYDSRGTHGYLDDLDRSVLSEIELVPGHLALAYHASFGTPVVVVRPFNTYGPRQSLRAVIPTIAAQLIRGGPVRLGSLSPTRDFTFVSDTVTGFVRAASAPEAIGRTVQLGTGVEISIGDLA